MGQLTRFNGDYKFIGIDTSSNVSFTANTITIDGNLTVLGNVTSVSSTDTNVNDNIITLNSGEMGAGVTRGTAGIEVDRGSLPVTSIKWDEPSQKWVLTNDGNTFANIAVQSPGGAVFSVIEDPNPQLGGNLDVLGRTIFSSNNEVVTIGLSGVDIPGGGAGSGLAIQNTPVVPGYVIDHNVVYSQSPGGGGTGIYVTNTTVQNEELISKTKAIIYALIM